MMHESSGFSQHFNQNIFGEGNTCLVLLRMRFTVMAVPDWNVEFGLVLENPSGGVCSIAFSLFVLSPGLEVWSVVWSNFQSMEL